MRRVHMLLASSVCMLMLAVGLAIFLPNDSAYAVDFFDDICERGGDGSPACNTTGTDELTGANGVLTRVTNIIAVIGGIVAVGILVYGGFTYVTSAGDSSKIGNAKNTIIYALVGLIVIALSRTIIMFVLSRL